MACSIKASMSERRAGSTAAETVEAQQTTSQRHAAANGRTRPRSMGERRELPDTDLDYTEWPTLNLMPGVCHDR